VPTQEFFARDMGLPLEMKPNYDDFSCQFRCPRAETQAWASGCGFWLGWLWELALASWGGAPWGLQKARSQ
jgi:hypothetical protein